MISFRCGICNQTLKTSDQQAGKFVRCPKCNTTLRAPVAAGAGVESLTVSSSIELNVNQAGSGATTHTSDAVQRNDEPDPAAIPRPRAAFQPARVAGSDRRFGFPCPYCSSKLEATDAQSRGNGNCPTCGQQIVVPIRTAGGRLIDPLSGQILKPDPHPVHAYAAAGGQAPRILHRLDGSKEIQCSRCRGVSKIDANNCSGCGLPFTMEGNIGDSGDPRSSLAIASLVLGIISIFTFCLPILGPLAIGLGIAGYRKSSMRGDTGGGRMSIAGGVLGCVGTGLSLYFLAG